MALILGAIVFPRQCSSTLRDGLRHPLSADVGRKGPKTAIKLLKEVIFEKFSPKCFAGLRGGCNFASLFGSRDAMIE